MKKRKPTKQHLTASALARRLGITRQLLASRRKQPEAPALDDVAGWKVFLAATGREGSAPLDVRRKIAMQRLRLLEAMAAGKERQNLVDDWKTLSRDEVTFAIARGMSALFNRLDRLANVEWPSSLKGMIESEICARVKSDIEKLKNDFRADLERLAKQN